MNNKFAIQNTIRQLIDEELLRQEIWSAEDNIPVEAREQWDHINHLFLDLLEISTRIDCAITRGDNYINEYDAYEAYQANN